MKKILNALEECVNNENGDKPRKIKSGEAIADYLGVSVEYLQSGKDE